MSVSPVSSPSVYRSVPHQEKDHCFVPSPGFLWAEIFRSYGVKGRAEGWAWTLTLTDPFEMISSGICTSRLAAIQACQRAIDELMTP